MNRRNFIKVGTAGLLGASLFSVETGYSGSQGSPTQLTASNGKHRFTSDQAIPAQVMYYNQSIPGPVIRIPQGKAAAIQFNNALDEPSSVHWHGLRIDNAMDGVADLTQPPVLPGESFNYYLTPPDAGTYWYHTHMRSWVQLAFGLAGVLIVDEENPPRVDQDLICAIDDWRLDDEMQMHTASLGSLRDWSHEGRTGNVFTVNGKVHPIFKVFSGERIRLRLLNIANSRVMNLLINEPAASVIAIDGQTVNPYPLSAGQLKLGPGARADLIIDMTLNPGQVSLLELVVGEYAYEIARFEYQAEIKRAQLLETPIALPPNPINEVALPDSFEQIPMLMEGGAMGGMQGAKYQGQAMGMRQLIQNKQLWAINGVAGMPEQPLFRVKRGTAISLEVNNDSRWPHAMHIHGHHFRHDKTPGVWRDTVLFDRQEQGSMQFIADNPGKWLIHCHMVEHMAGGMVTWFEVI